MFYHRTVASGQSISVTERLPVGDKLNDYTMNVTVDIKDSLGTRAVRNFLLKVISCHLHDAIFLAYVFVLDTILERTRASDIRQRDVTLYCMV